jgi:cysteine desulfurase / selenocysteine lyase
MLSAVQKVLNVESIRNEFPVLHQDVNGFPLVYFDNAATTQKPVRVINALVDYYKGYNANIHRGIHSLAERATSAFEETRKTVQHFLNAAEVEEIIFTKGTTDAINLVAQAYGLKFLKAGDQILISGLEHHSNIVPWQMLCESTGAELKVIPISPRGEWNLDDIDFLLTPKTKIVAVNHVSNALGTINPVEILIEKSHQNGAVVFLDGAQATAHLKVDVRDLDCDFYAFSAHKVYGPTGTGVLYGKRSLLEAMNPYQGGGEMIDDVSFEKTTYNQIPYKFEAGTPNIADVIAFKTALDCLNEWHAEGLFRHEEELLQKATEGLSAIKGLRIIGQAEKKIGVVSFLLDGYHPFDVGMLLDSVGIAVRTGHHCTQPLMKSFGIEGTVRASFAVYNTIEEVNRLIQALERMAMRKK